MLETGGFLLLKSIQALGTALRLPKRTRPGKGETIKLLKEMKLNTGDPLKVKC